MAKIGRGSEQAMIRLPDGMRDRIATIARANGRSMNAEIVQALEQWFPAGDLHGESRITLTLPTPVLEQLEAQAIFQSRPVNDEIVRLLKLFVTGNFAEEDVGTIVKKLEDAVHQSQKLAMELQASVREVTLLGEANTQWLEHIIYKYAFDNRMNRTEAILDILQKWLFENGYLQRRDKQHDDPN